MTQAGEPYGQRNLSQADEAHDAKRRGCLRRLLDWMPHWAVAILLHIGLTALGRLDLFDLLRYPVNTHLRGALLAVTLFIPGALKRFNVRHALIMSALALVCLCLVGLTFPVIPWPKGTLFPWYAFALHGLTVCLIGLGEFLLTGQRSWRKLAWIGCAGVAVSLLVCLVREMLHWSGWWIAIPGPGSTAHRPLSAATEYLLIAALTWAIVPLVVRASSSVERRRLAAAIAGLVGLAAGTWAFFGAGVYPLAEWSLTRTGPFCRHHAAWLLAQRGTREDFERLWAEIQQADWQEGLGNWQVERAWLYQQQEWREVSVSILARHDGAGTAQRLSEMLVADPAPALAEVSADVLAQNRRYEAVPILMRYALLGRGYYSDVCKKALEDMRLPRAAIPIFVAVRRYGQASASYVQGQDLELGAEYRSRLTAVLGWDAGANLTAWTKLYDERIRDAPSPLPESIRAETDLVIACFVDYWNTFQRWYRARGALSRRMLADDGKASEAQAFDEWRRQQSGKVYPFEPIDPEVERQAEIIQHYLRRATEAMRVAPPNWHVPTTQAFSREIDAYIKRVNAGIAKHFPSQGTSEVPQSEK